MALQEAARNIRGTEPRPLYIDEIHAEVESMDGYERDAVVRLDDLRSILVFVSTEPWTLLRTSQGDLTFNQTSFALETREGITKRKVSKPITYRQFFRMAQVSGTDVRGIIRAFGYSQRDSDTLIDDEKTRIQEIAEKDLTPGQLDTMHLEHVIEVNHIDVNNAHKR